MFLFTYKCMRWMVLDRLFRKCFSHRTVRRYTQQHQNNRLLSHQKFYRQRRFRVQISTGPGLWSSSSLSHSFSMQFLYGSTDDRRWAMAVVMLDAGSSIRAVARSLVRSPDTIWEFLKKSMRTGIVMHDNKFWANRSTNARTDRCLIRLVRGNLIMPVRLLWKVKEIEEVNSRVPKPWDAALRRQLYVFEDSKNQRSKSVVDTRCLPKEVCDAANHSK